MKPLFLGGPGAWRELAYHLVRGGGDTLEDLREVGGVRKAAEGLSGVGESRLSDLCGHRF